MFSISKWLEKIIEFGHLLSSIVFCQYVREGVAKGLSVLVCIHTHLGPSGVWCQQVTSGITDSLF